MAKKNIVVDFKSRIGILKKPGDVEIFGFSDGGAYEARSHTHALKVLKFQEVELTIRYHLTTHLTTMHISEGASS